MICHYCGRTWHVRLCPRSHVNPPDALVCGSCGSADLTETAGPVPFWIWLIRIGVLIIFIILIASLNLPKFKLNDQIIAQVIAIAILIFAINMSLSALPAPVRRSVLMLTKILKKWLLRVIGWCWEKVKIMLS
jgi:hypothetical protein